MRVGTLTIIARSGRRNRLATLGSMTNLSAAISNCRIAISLVALRHSSIDSQPPLTHHKQAGPLSRSPRRPTHLPPAEQMVVRMKHRLARVGASIYNDAKAAIGDSQLLGQLRGYLKNFSNERTIARFEIENAGDVLPWNNKDMHRRSGFDIFKRNDRFVAIDNVSLDLAIDDTAKEAIAHGYLQIYFSTNEQESIVPGRARQTRIDL